MTMTPTDINIIGSCIRVKRILDKRTHCIVLRAFHNILLLSNSLYCGIIFVLGGPMFVAFVSNPFTQIYIPTNYILVYIYKNRVCHRRNYVPTNQLNFCYPLKLTPTNNQSTKVMKAGLFWCLRILCSKD